MIPILQGLQLAAYSGIVLCVGLVAGMYWQYGYQKKQKKKAREFKRVDWSEIPEHVKQMDSAGRNYVQFVLEEFSKGCSVAGPRSLAIDGNPNAADCVNCLEGAVSAIMRELVPDEEVLFPSGKQLKHRVVVEASFVQPVLAKDAKHKIQILLTDAVKADLKNTYDERRRVARTETKEFNRVIQALDRLHGENL